MSALPEQFSELEPFVAEWALSNEEARFRKQLATSIESLREFYNAIEPRAEEIADYLNALDLKALPDDARTLFHLLITFIESAHPVELNWETTDIEDTFPPERLIFNAASRKSPV